MSKVGTKYSVEWPMCQCRRDPRLGFTRLGCCCCCSKHDIGIEAVVGDTTRRLPNASCLERRSSIRNRRGGICPGTREKKLPIPRFPYYCKPHAVAQADIILAQCTYIAPALRRGVAFSPPAPGAILSSSLNGLTWEAISNSFERNIGFCCATKEWPGQCLVSPHRRIEQRQLGVTYVLVILI